MSGPSIDISQVKDVFLNKAYAVMAERWVAPDETWRQIVDPSEILAPGDLRDMPYGHSEIGLSAFGSYEKLTDGAAARQSTIAQGWPWQIKMDEYGIEVSVADRLLESWDARGEIERMASKFAAEAVEHAKTFKDSWIADMLQDGTLTAGNVALFDQSYAAHADPYPGFIYDGLPWFDTAHLGKHSGTSYSNHTASLALTADNLQTVITTMRSTNAYDDRGNRITIRPAKLIVGADLESTAARLLNSELLPGSANNDVNFLRGKLQLVVNDNLTATGAWWVSTQRSGMRVVEDTGAAPRFATYRDETRRVTSFRSIIRWGAAPYDWRAMYCANKAAS